MKRSDASLSDEWWTDDKTYKYLCDYFRFYPNIDVAATEENTKCKYFLTMEEDALKTSWNLGRTLNDKTLNLVKDPKVWCNPPNSIKKKFILRAKDVWAIYDIPILMLVSSNVLTMKYFRDSECYDLLTHGYIQWVPVWDRPIFLLDGKPVLDKHGRPQQSRDGYIGLYFQKRYDNY